MSFHGMVPKTRRQQRRSRALLERRMERALRTSGEDREEPAAAETTRSSRPDGDTRPRERPEPSDEERRESTAKTEADRILAAAGKAGVVDTSDEDADATNAGSPDEDAVDRRVRELREAGEKVGMRFK